MTPGRLARSADPRHLRLRTAALLALAASIGLPPVARGEEAAGSRLVEAPELGGPIPDIERPVVDRAGALRADEVQAIEARLRALREQTRVQMAVLIVDTTGTASIEEFALAVAQRWGGGDAGRNDGVLFVLALGDRTMRLEVGVGLESKIPDAEAARILDAIKPKLRAQQYRAAVTSVIDGVSRAITATWWSRLRSGRSLYYWLGVVLAALPLGLILGLRKEKGPIIGMSGGLYAMLILIFLPAVGFFFLRPPALAFGIGAFVGFYASVTLHPALRKWLLAPLLAVVAAALLGWFAVGADRESLIMVYSLFCSFNLMGQIGFWVAVTPTSGWISSSGSYSYSSSSSSYSSSSSSYSSSSTSSSSSSSSSSYSGGGGSFGGGGASSSW